MWTHAAFWPCKSLAQRCASIGHHVDIQDYTNIAPGSNIGGGCKIGPGVYIGIGATLVDDVYMRSGSVIGAGAVVTKSLPPACWRSGSRPRS